MHHYRLVLLAVLALCSASLLQLAQKVGAQSGAGGGDAAGSGSGSFETVMENIVELGSPGEDDIRPGANGTAPGSVGDAHCSIFHHYLRLELYGCSTHYRAISCAGRCDTEETPNHFFSRSDSYVDPFISTCTCCSAVRYGFRKFILTLDCPDNSTLTVSHITAFAIVCGCAACY